MKENKNVLAVRKHFVLVQTESFFITFEKPKDAKHIVEITNLEKELGRYQKENYEYLGATEDYYLLTYNNWFITVDFNSKGIARDKIYEPFIGIHEVMINTLKNEHKPLIGFLHGNFIYYYNDQFQLEVIMPS